MKAIKFFLWSFFIFFILTMSFSVKAGEKDIIKQWIKEDMEEETVDRLEELAIKREKMKLETAKPKIKQLYQEAGELVKLKKYDEAREKYQNILTLNSRENKAREYMLKIDEIQELSREREVERVASQKEREEIEIFQNLAREGAELYRQKKYSDAQEKWGEALKYDPDNVSLKEWVNRARLQEVEEAKKKTLFEKELEEKAALSAVDQAYIPKSRIKEKREKVEEEAEVMEEGRKKIEELLDKIEIAELHLKDTDLRQVVNKITSMTKVTILVDWTAISEAAGVSAVTKVTREETTGQEGEVEKKEAAPQVESGEIKTMHLDMDIYTPMPLRTLLDYLMKITRLRYRVEEHAVLISTREALEKEEMVVKVYKLKYGMTKLRPVTLKPLGAEAD